MPSKSSAKGSGGKSQTKDVARAGTGQNSNTSTEALLQSSKVPAVGGSSQSPHLDRTEEIDSAQQPNNAMTQAGVDELSREGGVNKKKQKRRMKEAAKKAAVYNDPVGPQSINISQNIGIDTYGPLIKQVPTYIGGGETNGYDFEASDYEDPDRYEPDEADNTYYTYEAAQRGYFSNYSSRPLQLNGHLNHNQDLEEAPGSKTQKKKKAKPAATGLSSSNAAAPSSQNSVQRPPPPPPPTLGRSYLPASQHNHQPQKDPSKIWNTSTAEERERIKEFWLSLGEEERRSLVKVEKEAVLKKMKEQQKHSCSCTVCGRKRVAIEEELEVLYDAYYEELEQYANHQQVSLEDGASILPPPKMYHPMSRQPPRVPHAYNQQRSRGLIQEIGDGDDAGDEDEDSDVGDEDDLSDDYDDTEPPPQNSAATDFFNFGNSLTVQGGILTVADDLIRNDGKKFIEMMEQLAERRMQREEDAQFAAQGLPMQHSHSSNLEQDLYDDDEEEEEDYDSAEEDEFEEEDVDTMTEEQRMEEGRRMFQIFAARMFEQRVLTAYREKVALERQQKLIEELDDETKLDAQQKAKKAKEAQKKKDKKRQQKQAKDEEKAKRDAELAAQETAAKALEEKKAEELRQKKEEQRRKKEAEKKAQEEEKQRKEAEKQKKLQEAKELQQEQERKQREQREREKKKKEDAKRKEREEREARESEAKEKKEREASERRQREAKPKAESKSEDQTKLAGNANATQSLPMRPSPATTNSSTVIIAGPPGLLPPHASSIPNSPHLSIATPMVPKAPTPIRARQPSFQDSRTTSPRTSIPPPLSSTTSPILPSSLQSSTMNNSTLPLKRSTPPQPAQSQNPRSPRGSSPSFTTRPPGISGMPAPSGLGFGPIFSETMQSAQHSIPNGPHGFSAPMGAHGISYAPGTNGMRANPQSSMPPPPPNLISGNQYGSLGQQIPHRGSVASHTHSRNTSTSSNLGGLQPNPIGRPLSKQPPPGAEFNEQGSNGIPEQDPESGGHLGSSALLGDSEDEPIDEPRRGSIAHLSGPQNTRPAFGGPSGFPAPIGTSLPRGMHGGNGTWSNQQSPFGSAPSIAWPSTPGFVRQNAGNGFGSIGSSGHQNSSTQRAVTVRTLIASSCQKLTARSPMGPMNGWHPVESVLRDVNISKPQQVGLVEQAELLALCETVGNTQNGGGNFEVLSEPGMGVLVHFTLGRTPSMGMGGEIGSPVGGPVGGMFGNSRPFAQGQGFPPSAGF